MHDGSKRRHDKQHQDADADTKTDKDVSQNLVHDG